MIYNGESCPNAAMDNHHETCGRPHTKPNTKLNATASVVVGPSLDPDKHLSPTTSLGDSGLSSWYLVRAL